MPETAGSAAATKSIREGAPAPSRRSARAERLAFTCSGLLAVVTTLVLQILIIDPWAALR